MSASPRAANTKTAILDVAERLVQRRGFNAFSYGDVAAELGITTAALHYHYASKSELGESLITRYAATFEGAMQAIDATAEEPPAKLAAYCDIYRRALAGHRMCLCGMLAAEFETLATPMRDAVVGFFEENERWVAGLLESGREAGRFSFAGTAQRSARMVIAALEGAMLVARPYGDLEMFDEVAGRLLSDFAPA